MCVCGGLASSATGEVQGVSLPTKEGRRKPVARRKEAEEKDGGGRPTSRADSDPFIFSMANP
jgi:hypothetical protein